MDTSVLDYAKRAPVEAAHTLTMNHRWHASGRAKRLVGVVAALAALVLGTGTSQAGGFSSLDYGSRRMGTFAVVGKPDDATAIFHNPAGLTLRHGTEFYLYLSLIVGDLNTQFYDSNGILRPDHEITPVFNIGALPFLAVTSDFGLEDFRFGLGLYAPNGFGASMPRDEPTRYHVTDALFVASSATLAAAWKVSNRLSLGLTGSVVVTYLNASRVMNPLILDDPDKRFLPVSETGSTDYDLSIVGKGLNFAWSAGVLLTPVPELSIGASFSSGSLVELEGPVTLTDSQNKQIKATQQTHMALPFTMRAGVNWTFAPKFEVAFDITYWHYQVLQEQRSKLSEPLLGISEFRDPKNYANSFLWCVGLTYKATPDLELMMGWQMDYTPTPAATYAIESPSRDSKGVALGARWQVSEVLRLGAAFNRIWFDLTDIQNSQTTPPTNAKGHGGMTYFGTDITYTF